MKILITGAAGFIGYHLSRRLFQNPEAELMLVDNLERGKMDLEFQSLIAEPQVKFLKLDLTDPNLISALGGGYEHVYHLAAINGTRFFYEMPHEVLRVNTLTLINMLEWFRRENPDGKFCFTSSNEAYAGALEAFGQLPLPTPEDVPLVISDPYNPRWSYAGSKIIGELFLIHYAQHYRLRALIVRPHNFYGPRGGIEHVIPQFSVRIINRVDPFILQGADETRTFCYIDDAVKAMKMLMDSPATERIPPEIVHIGGKEETKVENLAQAMFALAGWQPASVETRPSPAGSVVRRAPDISKLERLTGWKPEISLKEGVARTMAWYSENISSLA